jgi:hypothetical protein
VVVGLPFAAASERVAEASSEHGEGPGGDHRGER